MFVGPGFAITIRHAESPDLAKVRHRLEASPELLAKGTEAVLYAVLDEVVDEYSPVDAGLENDIDEIEEQLFSGDPEVTRRIYDLASEVMEFQRATRPLVDMFAALERGFEKYDIDLELQRYLRDVKDHVIRIIERGESFRQLLQNALQVHATLVGQRQNEEMKRLTETSLAQSEQIEEDLELGRDPVRPDARGHDLRHELRLHARARLGVGLPVRRVVDDRDGARALLHLQASQLVVSERMSRHDGDSSCALPAASDRG